VPARVSKSRIEEPEDADMEEPPATALYAFNQTSLYVPPPVVNGRIPKNAFGNLDIYVPSMVPPGGYHVRHASAKNAARLLGIDYADAVTGFQFKGRHGTAITSGAIVAEEYREAVEAVIEGFQTEQENEEARLYSLECLKLWRRFLAGLRIKERLTEYTTTGLKAAKPDIVRAKMDDAEEVEDDTMEAGGFFPDAGEITAPTARRFNDAPKSNHKYGVAEEAPQLRRKRKTVIESGPESDNQSEEEYMPSPRKPPTRRRRMLSESPPAPEIEHYDPHEDGGGFMPDVVEESARSDGGFLPDADAEGAGGGFIHENNDASAANEFSGGFVPDTADSERAVENDGGFIPENDTALDSGGGFVPEVNEDMSAGGFMPEEDVPEVQSATQTTSKKMNTDTKEGVRSIMPDEQEEDTFDPNEMEDTFDPDDLETEIRALPREDSTGAHKQGEKEEDDHGSLLSHDPEDDDADPDWLYSD
jgi:xeroderma pigmentosum group C-complementing protein